MRSSQAAIDITAEAIQEMNDDSETESETEDELGNMKLSTNFAYRKVFETSDALRKKKLSAKGRN